MARLSLTVPTSFLIQKVDDYISGIQTQVAAIELDSCYTWDEFEATMHKDYIERLAAAREAFNEDPSGSTFWKTGSRRYQRDNLQRMIDSAEKDKRLLEATNELNIRISSDSNFAHYL